MKKNVASQSIGAQMITAADGTAFTGTVTVLITIDNGTQSASGGTAPAHEGNGYHSYTPTQAETNGDHLAFTWTGTGAIPVTIQMFTQFPQTVDNDTKISLIPTTAMRGTDNAALASVCTETRLQALTDWLNGGRLDLLLDAIPTTAMRGTDSAALASVCTETRLQALTDWLNGGRLDLLLDAIPTTAMRGTDSAALASVCTETRLQALTDWLNGGRLDLLLDAIPTTAMRGTDSALLAVNQVTVSDILTTQMTEAYAANGVAPSMAQSLFAIHQMLMEFSIAGTSYTVKKLDSAATAFVVTLNDATNPTGSTR